MKPCGDNGVMAGAGFARFEKGKDSIHQKMAGVMTTRAIARAAQRARGE